MAGKRGNPNFKAKRGEAGYTERNTGPATKAAIEACATFPTAEKFTEAADRYFDECDETGALYGEAGLCLGLTKYNEKGRTVTLKTLRSWYDGESCAWLQDAVQTAYLRIQSQIESDPRYQEKGGMATRGIFLQKQMRFGGYQDKIEAKTDATVKIIHGSTMDESDFQ